MSAATLAKILDSPKLPTLPTVAVKLLDLTRDPDVEIGDIALVVQYDQALSAKVLTTINSSYYALAQPCPSIKRALTYLGLSAVKAIVLGFSLVDMTRQCQGQFNLTDYWRRCMYSAAAARRIARITGSCDPDEAFIAALMQDIGMLALNAVLGDEYDGVLAEVKGNHLMLPHCETERLGFNHADVGGLLGEQWRLPEHLVDPIRQHHQRGSPQGRHKELVNAVILAYRMSNLICAENRKSLRDMVSAMSQMLFQISPDQQREIIEGTTEDVGELSNLLNVQIGDPPDVEAILSDTYEVLDSVEVAAAPTDEDHARMDGPKHFDERLAKLFAQARGTDQCLSLILIDLDRFQSLSKTLGSAAADTVLDVAANLLQVSFGGSGVVCRYRDEQFAVILPDAPRELAARMAERARQQIEREFIPLQDAPDNLDMVQQVTASLGVASLDPSESAPIPTTKVLIQLADRALDAAKRAGRNRVRVFKPHVRRGAA